jgi:hypothetical protein
MQASVEQSTCKRALDARSGALTEVVRLDRFRDGLTDEEFERFVASFPVQIRL